jgi:ATP-binding cassette subfamily C protein CydD
VHALLGFTAYTGSLKLNDQELAKLDLADYRRTVGWLAQNPRLLPGTLRDNLVLGHPDLPDIELATALQDAGADSIVAEKGWEYRISEQNGGLSVGQAQRLALARTLLKPRSLLLLDEPTASVDRLNERQILSALGQIIHQQTTLLITHRQDQLTAADRIFFIDQGMLVDQGSYSELLARNPAFGQLLNTAAVGEPS